MTDFIEDDPEDAAIREVRLQALADMFDAQDLIEKGGVLRALLQHAFEEAKEAIQALVTIQTEDTNVRNLQWQVTRYDALVSWTRKIVLEGQDAAQDADADTIEILRAIVRGENDGDDD